MLSELEEILQLGFDGCEQIFVAIKALEMRELSADAFWRMEEEASVRLAKHGGVVE